MLCWFRSNEVWILSTAPLILAARSWVIRWDTVRERINTVPGLPNGSVNWLLLRKEAIILLQWIKCYDPETDPWQIKIVRASLCSVEQRPFTSAVVCPRFSEIWKISPNVWHFLKIEELEEQCNEIDKEKERNAQLSRRLQELETELQDKELVSALNAEMSCFRVWEGLSASRLGCRFMDWLTYSQNASGWDPFLDIPCTTLAIGR